MSTRILAVADWSVDPRAVADRLAAESRPEEAVFGLLVPPRLFGLHWIGDPYASCPCAERQVAELERLMRGAGLTVERAAVGDPERVPAIRAALDAWPAGRVLLFDRRRFGTRHALGVSRRVERATGRAVERVTLSSSGRTPGFLRRPPRCATV